MLKMSSVEYYIVISPDFERFKCHILLEPESSVPSPQHIRSCIS